MIWIQTQFTAQVEAAVVDGNWGGLQKQVKRWEGALPGLVADSDQGKRYHAWVDFWSKARASSGALGNRYQATVAVVSDVAQRCGLSERKGTVWESKLC